MIPENAKTHDEAIEALIAASLRAPDKEQPITEEEISRYVDQQITLSVEDEEALKKSESNLFETIRKILQGGSVEKSTCTNSKEGSGKVGASVASKRRFGPTDEFVEAVVIAQLTRLLSSPDYPLGRFRYNKFAYFSHRRAEAEVGEHFVKKAAGPYSPWARYQGPEGIALKNGYVKRVGFRGGLLPGDKIENIEPYLSRYAVCRAIQWVVDQFRYSTNDELELLATVDFAVLDVKKANAAIALDAVRQIIEASKEWKPKLKRSLFSDENIERALSELRVLFPSTYAV